MVVILDAATVTVEEAVLDGVMFVVEKGAVVDELAKGLLTLLVVLIPVVPVVSLLLTPRYFLLLDNSRRLESSRNPNYFYFLP